MRARDVSKTKERLKVLSSSGIRGTKSIYIFYLSSSIASFIWKPPHFELNFGVIWVRDIKIRSRNIHLSRNVQVAILGVKVLGKLFA